MRRRESGSSDETEKIGAALARELAPGDVVLLEGEFGAGKTTLVRGACKALGADGLVTSPTFTIGQRYGGRVGVSHLDLFRIVDLADEDPELLADYIDTQTITFIELQPGSPTLRLEIEQDVARLGRIAVHVLLEHAGGDWRILTIQ